MQWVDARGLQRGAVLPLAMVFTAMLALLSAGVLRVVVMELRMAANESARLAAFQFAEAIVSAIVHRDGFFPTDASPGSLICDSGDVDYPCPQLLLPLPGDGSPYGYRVSRRESARVDSFPLREAESRVSGSDRFSAQLFDVSVEVGVHRGRGGSAHIIQGVAVRIPADREG